MRNVIGAGLVLASLQGIALGQNQPAPAPAAQEQPAVAKTAVPVKKVVLFSSGVGYFEHSGTVTGNAATELQFKTAQINDILKSLVLQDMDGGKVAAVTYPSQDPVEKTLKSFQIDITGNPPLGDLLNQLRGADVTLVLNDSKLVGTVLGVEKKQRPVDKEVITRDVVNLLTDNGIQSVFIEDVREIQLKDPKLREELKQALLALAAARDQDKKPVKIEFTGQGDRHVKIGYVVEAPVWKTSYRLILGDEKPLAEGETSTTRPGSTAKLQGWAIVENQTDNDWNNVQLSLVSGRPISFVQDLYKPLYIPRPVVQPDLYAGVVPDVDRGGMGGKGQAGEALMRKSQRANAPEAPMSAMAAGRAQSESSFTAGLSTDEKHGLDASASVSSLANAAKIGELFQYTINDVSLPRRQSSMLPIVTDDVGIEKVSIYNASVLPRNPLYGVRLKNTTEKSLLGGPVTVLDDSSYAGDARIDNLPPGQERLLSYGIDLQMLVDSTTVKQEDVLLSGKIVKGVLQLSRKHRLTQEYSADNKADSDKTLIVEHPIRANWKLVETPDPIETTDALYRFKLPVPAGKTEKLTVVQENTDMQAVAILGQNPETLVFYAKTGEISGDVKAALNKAIDLQQAVADTQRKINETNQELAGITQEQQRIRENMKTVDNKSAYYTRLAGKLNDQETKIESLQTSRDDLQKSLESQRKDLEDYVNGLNVG